MPRPYPSHMEAEKTYIPDLRNLTDFSPSFIDALSKKAEVSSNTIKRLLSGSHANRKSVAAIIMTLAAMSGAVAKAYSTPTPSTQPLSHKEIQDAWREKKKSGATGPDTRK